MKQIKRKKY